MFRSVSCALALLLLSLSTPGVRAHTCELGPGEESHDIGRNESGPVWPWQVYRSSPYNPPELEITTNGEPLAEGLVLFGPSRLRPTFNSVKEDAALIMTDEGQLVWNGPRATNLRLSQYKGSPILTYWRGVNSAGGNTGHGYGNVTFLDTSYREILTVCPTLGIVNPEDAGSPCEADFHEAFVTDRDTLLISAYNATPADLSGIGGPAQGWIFDSLIFELEPESQQVLSRWSAIEHVPITDTKQPLQGTGNQSVPFDYFHVNSIINVGDAFLVNARHTWATYLVSTQGEIEWTLQGETGGDFGSLPPGGQFKWQHYAIPHNVTSSSITISYFDNSNSGVDNGTAPSKGLTLGLSLPPSKDQSPQLVQSLIDAANPLYADSQGSNQLLENGNGILDYGQIPVLKEFGPDGNLRWTARAGGDNVAQSYRGFKEQWHATPCYPPSLVVRQANGTGCLSTGYVSWNGATDVAAWEIWEGSSQDQLHAVGRISFAGFETSFGVGEKCAQAVAIIDGEDSSKSDVACI